MGSGYRCSACCVSGASRWRPWRCAQRRHAYATRRRRSSTLCGGCECRRDRGEYSFPMGATAGLPLPQRQKLLSSGIGRTSHVPERRQREGDATNDSLLFQAVGRQKPKKFQLNLTCASTSSASSNHPCPDSGSSKPTVPPAVARPGALAHHSQSNAPATSLDGPSRTGFTRRLT